MILPKGPDTGTAASYVPPPPPDATVAKDLQGHQAAADQNEADVKRESANGPAVAVSSNLCRCSFGAGRGDNGMVYEFVRD